MNIDILKQLLQKHNKDYNKIWSEILEPNQREINNLVNYADRKPLQDAHDKIAIYINEQSDLIEYLIGQLAAAPDKREVEYLRGYIKCARAYIKDLGGNPSNLSYIKPSDLC